MSAITQLQTGQRPPFFLARSDTNPRFAFGSVAGRWVVLLFFGSLADPEGRAAHEAVLARRRLFNDHDLAYFGVSADPEDKTVRGLAPSMPGLRYFYDDDRAVAELYGVVEPTGRIRPTALLLDRSMRLVATAGLEDLPAMLEQAKQMILAERRTPALSMAPVLTVPRVFEPELCQRLIDHYEAQGGTASGVMREIDGKTVGVMDDAMKRRRDAQVRDRALARLTRDRIIERLAPEIFRSFQWHATRIERFMVACYDAADKGFFNAHRDNTTPGTAHRRFAVTLNLNEDYDGGELCFPEFGQTLYKPPPGGATVFNCSLLHAAKPVTRGTRYVFVPFLYDEAAAKIRDANRDKVVTGGGYRDDAKAEPQAAE